MYHHSNRAFGTALDGNRTDAALNGKGKKGNPGNFDAKAKKGDPGNGRQTRSMSKRNAGANKQFRTNAGNGNGNGAGGAVQRPSTAATFTSSFTASTLLAAPTSRPTTFSSVSNFSSSYQHTGHVDNIDDRDKEDPLCATDYVQEMVSILALPVVICILVTFLFSPPHQSCTSFYR